jgi:hypothetical protein
MENNSDNVKKSFSKHQLLKLVFFYLITFIAFCAAFYEALYVSDIKMASLLFATAFLSFVFSQYREFEAISWLGFHIKKYKRLESEAEELLERLKIQSKFMIDEIIFSILQTNLLSSVEPIWNRLLNFRENLKASKGDQFTEQNVKAIRKHFIFEFIHARFYRAKNILRERISVEFNHVESKIFPRPIQDIDTFNQFVAIRDKVFDMSPIYKIKISDCETITINDITSQLELIKLEMKKYDIDFQVPEEFLSAIEDLKQVLNSPDILSKSTIDLIIRAEQRIR